MLGLLACVSVCSFKPDPNPNFEPDSDPLVTNRSVPAVEKFKSFFVPWMVCGVIFFLINRWLQNKLHSVKARRSTDSRCDPDDDTMVSSDDDHYDNEPKPFVGKNQDTHKSFLFLAAAINSPSVR
jgi:hypothetical protein